MSYGLQIFREDGTLQLAVTDRLTHNIGSVSVTLSPRQTVFVTKPISEGQDFFCLINNIFLGADAAYITGYTSTGVYVFNASSTLTLTYTVTFLGF